MDRFASDHSGDLAGCGKDIDLKSRQSHFINAADGAERDQSGIGDIDHLKTDFVVMSRKHDAERGIRVQDRNGIARHIDIHLVREGFQTLPEGLCTGNFKPGRTGSSH